MRNDSIAGVGLEEALGVEATGVSAAKLSGAFLRAAGTSIFLGSGKEIKFLPTSNAMLTVAMIVITATLPIIFQVTSLSGNMI